ncbi:MAG: hypothetical protein ACYSU0_02080 [Planctomycetota bacterium]
MRKAQPGSDRIPTLVSNLKKCPTYLFVRNDLADSELVRILLSHPDRKVRSVEADGSLRSYYLEDTILTRAREEFHRSGSAKYLLKPPIGGYSCKDPYFSGEIARSESARLDHFAWKMAGQRLYGPRRRVCDITVYIGIDDGPDKAVLHESLSFHVKWGARTARGQGGVTVRSSDPYEQFEYVSWISGGNLIYVAGQVVPAEILRAYLGKYPSDLPADFRPDAEAWARRELEDRVRDMRKHVASPNKHIAANANGVFERAVGRLRRFFVIPDLSALYKHEKGLYATHVAGKEWKCDWETYLKEFHAVRRQELELAEALLEKAKAGIRLDTKTHRFVIGEKASPASSRLVPAAVGLGAVVAFAGSVYAVWRWKRPSDKPT